MLAERDLARVKECGGDALRLAVLRRDQEQQPPLVRDGDLRQPRQAAPSARRGRAPREPAFRRLARRCGACRLLARWSRPTRPASAGWRCRALARAMRRHRSPEPARISRRARPARRSIVSSPPRRPRPISPTAASASPADRFAPTNSSTLAIDGRPFSDVSLYFLVRFWLATPDARAADPAPLGDVAALPRLPPRGAYALAAGARRPAAGGDLRAAGGRLFAGLRPRRPHQPRLRRPRRRRRLCARRSARCSPSAQTPATILATALTFGGAAAALWGIATSRWVFAPLRDATGQQALVGERRPGDVPRRVPAPDAG